MVFINVNINYFLKASALIIPRWYLVFVLKKILIADIVKMHVLIHSIHIQRIFQKIQISHVHIVKLLLLLT